MKKENYEEKKEKKKESLTPLFRISLSQNAQKTISIFLFLFLLDFILGGPETNVQLEIFHLLTIFSKELIDLRLISHRH